MFYYKISFWGELENRQIEESGLVSATSYAEATQKLMDFYGEDNVVTTVLEKWEDVVIEDDLLNALETNGNNMRI